MTHYHHSQKNKEKFFKEKRKGKRFIFLSKLNLAMVKTSPANRFVVGLLSFVIVWILNTINVVFFQFELKMAVHAVYTKKKNL